MAVDGVVANLRVDLSLAPGVGTSNTITLYKNASPTSLSCTISNTATACTDLVNTVSVVPTDILAWSIAPTGTTVAAGAAVSSTFTGTNAGEVSIGGTTRTSANTLTYWALTGGREQTTNADGEGIAPTNFTLDKMYLASSAAPGVGTSYTITLYKNGSPTLLTATISGTGTTASELSTSVSFAPGDRFSIEGSPTGSPAARQYKWGFRFRPAIDGESMFTSADGIGYTANATRYPEMAGSLVNNTTEANAQAIAAVDFTLRKLYFLFAPVLTGSQQRSVTSRINGSSGTLTAAQNLGNPTPSDTTNSDAVTAGQFINWMTVPTGTPPANTTAAFSAVAYIAPPVLTPAVLVPSKFRVYGGKFNIFGGSTIFR